MISMLSKRPHERKHLPYTCRMTTRDRIQRSFMTLIPAGRQVWHPHLSRKTGMRLSTQQENRYDTLTPAGRQVWNPHLSKNWTHTQAGKKLFRPSPEQEDRYESLTCAGGQVWDSHFSKKTNRPSTPAKRQEIDPHPIRKTGMRLCT